MRVRQRNKSEVKESMWWAVVSVGVQWRCSVCSRKLPKTASRAAAQRRFEAQCVNNAMEAAVEQISSKKEVVLASR